MKINLGGTVGLLFVCVSLLSCQTSTSIHTAIPAEEAKKIAVKIAKIKRPPPRRISKILSGITKRPNPVWCDAEDYEGLPESDLRKVLNLQTREWQKFNMLAKMGRYAFFHGSPQRAIYLQKWANDYADDWTRTKGFALLSIYQSYLGLHEDAENSLSRAHGADNFLEWSARRFKADHEFFLNFADGIFASNRGKYDQAIAKFNAALENTKDMKSMLRNLPGFSTLAQIELAKVFADTGELLIAEEFTRVGVSGVAGGMFVWTAESSFFLIYFSEILFRQGRLEEAERISEIALQMMDEVCVSPSAVPRNVARSIIGAAKAANGDWVGAIKNFQAIKDSEADDVKLWNDRLGSNAWLGVSYLQNGQIEEAREIFLKYIARTSARYGQGHYNTVEAKLFLDVINSVNRPDLNTIRLIGLSLDNIVNNVDASNSISAVPSRIRRIEVAIDYYLDAIFRNFPKISNRMREDLLKASFRAAQIVRARKVSGALLQSSSRTDVNDPELARLIRSTQDARRRMATLREQLGQGFTGKAGDRDSRYVAAIRKEIKDIALSINSIENAIVKRNPKFANVLRSQPIDLEQVKGILHSDEALIVTFSSDRATYVWATGPGGIEKFSQVQLPRSELADIVSRLRQAVDTKAATFGEIPDFDVALAYQLYKKLLAPVETAWKSAKHLIVVTDGPLAQIPFSIIPTSDNFPKDHARALFARYKSVPWLIRDYAISYSPSVEALTSLRTSKPANEFTTAFVGFGDPWFNLDQARLAEADLAKLPDTTSVGPQLRRRSARISRSGKLDDRSIDSIDISKLLRLPDTAEEVLLMARYLGANPSKDVFLGKDATEERVKTMDLTDRRIIAFSTHALVPGDLDGLREPALALTPPTVSGAEAAS
ncbi:MAG: CHAT domain-containing protein, partial [Rhodospirillaceae bacterium]|nr:CHAT domain-containing protein [Rhodospirillaceae bacterium]